MAKPTISLMGATYPDVSGVELPTSGGGTASFPFVEGSQTVTVNGTYDVTALASMIVNVSGGGGSSYTLVATQDIVINQTSTTSTSVGTIDLGYHTKNEILYVCIRDKAGPRAGYFYGSDNFIIDLTYANGSASLQSYLPRAIYGYNSSMKLVNTNSGTSFTNTTSANGVIASQINKNGVINIVAKYNSSYGTINGTFRIDVYKLEWPTNRNPFI